MITVDQIQWDYQAPFTLTQTVTQDDIDRLGHTNNVVYLKWAERVAWQHTTALGLGWETYQRLNRVMVARKHELEYLAATYEGDELVLGTWITTNDKKLSTHRSYQFVRLNDGVTVLRGTTLWVCVDLETGKPKRMPPEFVEGYKVAKKINI